MSQVLELSSGQRARLIAIEGEFATLETASPAPPGAILELLVLRTPARLKVRRCQRRTEGDGVVYRIEARWLNLSRQQRESLAG